MENITKALLHGFVFAAPRSEESGLVNQIANLIEMFVSSVGGRDERKSLELTMDGHNLTPTSESFDSKVRVRMSAQRWSADWRGGDDWTKTLWSLEVMADYDRQARDEERARCTDFAITVEHRHEYSAPRPEYGVGKSHSDRFVLMELRANGAERCDCTDRGGRDVRTPLDPGDLVEKIKGELGLAATRVAA